VGEPVSRHPHPCPALSLSPVFLSEEKAMSARSIRKLSRKYCSNTHCDVIAEILGIANL
jgi:hypothetical protein